jgi:HD-GYP domain-containing protein (c-di-GMP phosphodiesterase class II)
VFGAALCHAGIQHAGRRMCVAVWLGVYVVSGSDLSLGERVALVLRGSCNPSGIDALCEEYHIDRDDYDRWCQAFLAGGTERLDIMQRAESMTGGGSYVDTSLDYSLSNFMLLGVLAKLITVLNQRDSYTKRHSDDVAQYSIEIGKQLGLDSDTMQTLYVAGTLHDVGKISISDHILNKKGRLTDEEMALMREHPRLAIELIGSDGSLKGVAEAVYHHHERYDGKGYPEGLSGENIPLLARILTVADAFSAMTTDRPYRPAMSAAAAARELMQQAGAQFDPALVSIFVERVLRLPANELRERS